MGRKAELKKLRKAVCALKEVMLLGESRTETHAALLDAHEHQLASMARAGATLEGKLGDHKRVLAATHVTYDKAIAALAERCAALEAGTTAARIVDTRVLASGGVSLDGVLSCAKKKPLEPLREQPPVGTLQGDILTFPIAPAAGQAVTAQDAVDLVDLLKPQPRWHATYTDGCNAFDSGMHVSREEAIESLIAMAAPMPRARAGGLSVFCDREEVPAHDALYVCCALVNPGDWTLAQRQGEWFVHPLDAERAA